MDDLAIELLKAMDEKFNDASKGLTGEEAILAEMNFLDELEKELDDIINPLPL